MSDKGLKYFYIHYNMLKRNNKYEIEIIYSFL
jgi:hypothetical protein